MQGHCVVIVDELGDPSSGDTSSGDTMRYSGGTGLGGSWGQT